MPEGRKVARKAAKKAAKRTSTNGEQSNETATLDLPCPACGEAVFVLPFTEGLNGRLNCPKCHEEVVISFNSKTNSFYCVTSNRRRELIEKAKEVAKTKFSQFWSRENGHLDFVFVDATFKSLDGDFAAFNVCYKRPDLSSEKERKRERTMSGFDVDISKLP